MRIINNQYSGSLTTTSPASTNVTIKSLLRGLDTYSDHISAEEYRAFLESQESHYTGIGIEIEKNNKGEVVCNPLLGSPAARAGIQFGDILLSVDETVAFENSLYSIAAATRGPTGSKVAVTIRTSQGQISRLTIPRQPIDAQSVSIKTMGAFNLLTISRFTRYTRRNLHNLLDDLGPETPLVIDLRGNSGGDFHGAIDCAMMFLDQDQPIVTVQRKQETERHVSTTPALSIRYPVYILQDKRTASAAEVFTAALTQNNRALSIGEKSYGKGIIQNIFKLADESVMILTTGTLLPPSGEPYHGKGLPPDKGVAELLDSAYFSRIEEELSAVPARHPEPVVLIKVSKRPVKQVTKAPLMAGKQPAPTTGIEFYACLEPAFPTREEVLHWSRRLPGLEKGEMSLIFQDTKFGNIVYQLCIGPELTRKNIELTRKNISQSLGYQTQIRTLSTQESPEPEQVSTPAEPSVRSQPLSRDSWYLLAGAYQTPGKVLIEQQRIKRLNKYITFAAGLSDTEADRNVREIFQHYYKTAELQIIDLVSPLKTTGNSITYYLFIGPYTSKNDQILSTLIISGAVSKGTVWVRATVPDGRDNAKTDKPLSVKPNSD